ncbi:hypothetical protein ACJX0J_035176, partial [Zea mays]
FYILPIDLLFGSITQPCHFSEKANAGNNGKKDQENQNRYIEKRKENGAICDNAIAVVFVGAFGLEDMFASGNMFSLYPPIPFVFAVVA